MKVTARMPHILRIFGLLPSMSFSGNGVGVPIADGDKADTSLNGLGEACDWSDALNDSHKGGLASSGRQSLGGRCSSLNESSSLRGFGATSRSLKS